MNLKNFAGSPASTAFTGLLAVMLVVCVVYAPSEAFKASGQGLTIWWHIVFPALLPFVMLSQMLLAGGFAHGLGALVEPLTRRLLGLPGTFGWVLPLGMTAGFPAAADTAATLYKQGKISASEAERIAGAAHFCSPMLLVIVIGTGFFGRPEFGLLLLAVHWAAGLAAGITLHFLLPDRSPARNASGSSTTKASNRRRPSRLRQALRSMEQARQEDGRSLGRLLGDTVTSGVQTLMITGGYMLIFSIIIHVILLALPGTFFSVTVKSLLEVHLGSYAMSRLSSPALSPAVFTALLGAALGWSGLCAYLQVRAILGPAGIRERFFLLNRLLHGAYAYAITLLLWKPLIGWLPGAFPAFAQEGQTVIGHDTPAAGLPTWQQAFGVMGWQLWMLALLTLGFATIALVWNRRGEH
ncbi:nucleoside recognition domain-containing protein [Paenibacillus macerans]|uniref:nucleoside recognition domain-containing protein n=1 Tax=Paenibacillus macerans TaxID=44252 RepID=UPI002042532E|nr:nucleoside recognition domain-containing protein [Paenibacillus macerans]MCM3699288.1 nucleoside recognition domain-containing protein [Paenibacillus macerans]